MDTATALPAATCLADEECRILTCDDAYMELLGRERSEIVGRHPLDLTHSLDRGLNRSLLGHLSAGSGAFSITKRYIRGDRTLIWVTNTVAPVRDGAGPLRVCATSMRAASPASTSALAHNVDAARRMCAAFLIGKKLLGNDLVTAPAAEILLQLYRAEIEGRSLTGETLASMLQISTEAAVRWLRVLKQRKLIESDGDRAVDALAFYRIAKPCEMALDALIAGSGI